MCFAPIIQPTSESTRHETYHGMQCHEVPFFPPQNMGQNPFHIPSQNAFISHPNPYQKNFQAPIPHVIHYFPFNPYKSNEIQNINPYSLNPQKDQKQKMKPSVQKQLPQKEARYEQKESSSVFVKQVKEAQVEDKTLSKISSDKNEESNKFQSQEIQLEYMKNMIEFGKEKKPSGIIPCKFFMKGNGRCKYGNNCRFSHVHFYPMPKTFTEDPVAQKHVKCTLDAVKEKERKLMEKESKEVNTQLKLSENSESVIEQPESTNDNLLSSQNQTETNTSEETVEGTSGIKSNLATIVSSKMKCRFNWNYNEMIYREAVHYSSEGSETSTSKVCSAVLKILQESEEYQRIEVICEREQKKHMKYFESMSPAFVGGSLIIMIKLKAGIQAKDLPMAIPGCIDGVKTQITLSN